MPRFLKICGVALIGLILVAAGIAYDLIFAGLPYQDPSPAVQAEWEQNARTAGMIVMAGIALFVMGAAAIPLLWYKLRKRPPADNGDEP